MSYELKPRLNWIEALLIIAGVAVVMFAFGRAAAPPRTFVPRAEGNELETLAQRYGPQRYSEHAEEWIVRDFFQGKRGGVFVDVGAYDYQRLSNTYYLEATLGWSGVAIEPQTKFAADYQRYRPRTTFVPLFVSDHSDGTAVLNVAPTHDTTASGNKAFADSYEATTPVMVATVTLDDLLTRLEVNHVDFVSIDIELAEPAALAGFSINRFRPALVCVEAHPEVRQQILDYFATHGYTVIGKYLRADTSNLWFRPLDHPSAS